MALHCCHCQTGVNVVWSLQPWWSQLQQGVKWKLSTWNTMGCAHFICQTSLNLYFLMVTMATCYFMIQTCFWFCNLVTPRSQNKITIYPCLLNHLHLIPMPIKMPISHANAQKDHSLIWQTYIWQGLLKTFAIYSIGATSFSAPSHQVVDIQFAYLQTLFLAWTPFAHPMSYPFI